MIAGFESCQTWVGQPSGEMEILAEHDGLVTNAEVLEHIRARQAARAAAVESATAAVAAAAAVGGAVDETADGNDGKHERKKATDRSMIERDWIEKKIVGYIDSVPCVPKTASARLLAALDEDETLKQLEEGERLQMLNLRTKLAVEVHLVVEDCSERLTDDDTDRLLNLVAESCAAEEQ